MSPYRKTAEMPDYTKKSKEAWEPLAKWVLPVVTLALIGPIGGLAVYLVPGPIAMGVVVSLALLGVVALFRLGFYE